MDLRLGLSAATNSTQGIDTDFLAGSLEASIGDLTAGVNMASADFEGRFSGEYIATGVGYQMGALNVGVGVETHIIRLDGFPQPFGEFILTNLFAGAEYELSDGLTIGVGIGNLDSDNTYNNETRRNGTGPRSFNAVGNVRVEF